MNTKSIAILGCTGHIGKNLIFNFKKEKKDDLFLFSRNEQNIKKITTTPIYIQKTNILLKSIDLIVP